MATKKKAGESQVIGDGQLKARVLVSGAYGNCDDVVVIDATDVERLAGIVDATPASVEYAESLAK